MKSSVDTFLLYFDGKMIQTIVDHTNIESVREKGNKWKDIDTKSNEIVHWMFATYGAPIQNDISVEVLFSPVNRHPFVRAAFSLNRFSNLLMYLRFNDKTARSARCERGVFCPISDL